MNTTPTPRVTDPAPEAPNSAAAVARTKSLTRADLDASDTAPPVHPHRGRLARLTDIVRKRGRLLALGLLREASEVEDPPATASTTHDHRTDPSQQTNKPDTTPNDSIETNHASQRETVPPHNNRWRAFTRTLGLRVIPLLTLLFALAAAYLKYDASIARENTRAATESVHAATDATIAILSYTPDTAEAKLTAARDRLTGTFRDAYTSLTHDVVIPGAKQKQISATATVPAAASVSASVNHAVVLVFVNQAVIMGNDAPTQTASVVQVTLDKLGNRWLISAFEPK